MAEHECTQTNNIQKLLKIVTDGNGQPSLVQQIGELSTKIDSYMGRQEDLIKEFGITSREFYEFRSHVQTVEVEKDKSDMRKRWRTGVLITLLVAVISTLTIVFVNRDKVLASRIDDANVKSVTRGVDSLPLYQ
jgi:hypothetical protein